MITLTRAAEEAICDAARKRMPRPRALRVGIRAGGCDGFEHVFEWYDGDVSKSDVCATALEEYDGYAIIVPVICDPKSLTLLAGATLDYQRTLMQSGFRWINPRQTGTCGCGKSAQFDGGTT